MNYNDERIKALELQKAAELTNQNSVYQGLLNENQALLDKQNSWQDTYLNQQNALYDQNTNLAVNKLQQAQQDTTKAYQTEARASEQDYQNFINPYGSQAEQNAMTGMSNTGYSESTKSTAYNTSRNRTALARATAQKVNVEYENQIAQAKLSNDSQKAALALELLKQKLANELNAFQTSSNIKTTQLGMQTDLNNTYYNKYQDVFNQQKYEQEQARALKQYQEQLAYQKKQDTISQQNWQKQFDYQKQQDAIQNAQSWYSLNNSGSSGAKVDNGTQLTDTKQISTPYYKGIINPDTYKGVLGNGYQPDNIGGKKLTKTKDTITRGTTTLNGEKKTVKQNIWSTPDGQRWYWEGRLNAYVPIN